MLEMTGAKPLPLGRADYPFALVLGAAGSGQYARLARKASGEAGSYDMHPYGASTATAEQGSWAQPTSKRARTQAPGFAPGLPLAPRLASEPAADCDSATDTDDEAAAALLLGMHANPQQRPASDTNPLALYVGAAVPRRRRSAPHRPPPPAPPPVAASDAGPAAANATVAEEAAVPQLVCGQCRQPVALSGERRPTFVCGNCRSRNGSHKRAQRALLAADPSVTVTVQQVLEATCAAHVRRSQATCDRSTPRAREDSSSSKDAADTHVTGGGTSSSGAAGSGGGEQQCSDAAAPDTHGRCKCGKRIAADHPPCKSELMLLCEKFQRRFGQLGARGEPQAIMLKDAVAELGVSRRRLYDIINVLEAVEIVRRTGKLTYEWRGLGHLPALLRRLVQEEGSGVPVEERVKRTPGIGAASGAQDTGGDSKEEAGRTQHTLWALSRKFVRVLLTRQGPLPLTEVAVLLMDDGVTEQRKSQTQITIERRLYDIGSILTAVGLIEKTYLGKRQPAFMWKQAQWAALDAAPSSAPPSHLPRQLPPTAQRQGAPAPAQRGSTPSPLLGTVAPSSGSGTASQWAMLPLAAHMHDALPYASATAAAAAASAMWTPPNLGFWPGVGAGAPPQQLYCPLPGVHPDAGGVPGAGLGVMRPMLLHPGPFGQMTALLHPGQVPGFAACMGVVSGEGSFPAGAMHLPGQQAPAR